MQQALIFLVVRKLLPSFLRSTPLQLSDQEIQRINSVKYPALYKIIYPISVLIFMVLLLGIPIGFIFVVPNWFLSLQNQLFGQNAIYFASESGWIMALLYFFILLILGGSILSFVMWIVSPGLFRDYMMKESIKSGWPFDYTGLLKSYFLIGVVVFLISLPLQYFALRDYKAVYPEKIIANAFFSFVDRVYKLDDLQEVIVSSQSFIDRDDSDVDIDLYFIFNDGKKVDFWIDEFDVTENKVKDLYAYLELHNVKLTIEPPENRTLGIMQSCYNDSRQKTFLAVFKLNDFLLNRWNNCN